MNMKWLQNENKFSYTVTVIILILYTFKYLNEDHAHSLLENFTSVAAKLRSFAVKRKVDIELDPPTTPCGL